MLRLVGTPLAPQLGTNWSEAAFVGNAIKSPRQAASREQTRASFLFMPDFLIAFGLAVHAFRKRLFQQTILNFMAWKDVARTVAFELRPSPV
jgi:hypothetical protein